MLLNMLSALILATLLPAQQILVQSIDGRLKDADARVALSRFANYPSGAKDDKFVPNPKFWAKGVDLSCASPWNSAGGALRAGTLISKRHFICVKHFPFWKGVRILFVDSEANVCPCTVEAVKALDGVDIMVGLLNAEVTPTIKPARILPHDYAKYIGNGNGLPVATFNQHEQLVVSELTEVSTNRYLMLGVEKRLTNIPINMGTRLVSSGMRASYCKLLTGGDSGNPAFLIFNETPVLLYCDCSNNASQGPPLHLYRQEIQAAMDELCPGYRLEAFDFASAGRTG